MEETKVISDNVVHVVEVKSKEESNDSASVDPVSEVRLTPTGKISHAKTRVYTQRYRKEWEYMDDFKDWLTAVPQQATRAFCKYCQRNLHAHRLSLLKHMCTLKHQRAAVQYMKRVEATSANMNNKVEKAEPDYEDEEYESYDENSGVQEEISIEDGEEEEVVEESEEEIEEVPELKKIRLNKEQSPDTLAQALADVEQDYLTENDESIQLEMVVESDNDADNDNEDQDTSTYQFVNCENISSEKSEIETIPKNVISGESIKMAVSEAKTDTTEIDNKKVYFFSSGGKSYTLVKSKLPQFMLNSVGNKKFAIAKPVTDVKNLKDTKNQLIFTPASTSGESINKLQNPLVLNKSSMITKSVLLKKPIVSTNVLETSKGIPVCGLQVSLYKLQDGRWTFMQEGLTSGTGTCTDFSNATKGALTSGRYKLHYDVEKYYTMRKVSTIYPFIEIVFDIKDPNGSYHIPLLLSPFSYSTYKGTHR